MNYLKIVLFFFGFMLVSCSSLYDIEKDKLEFVKSIMIESKNCKEIVLNSKYYKKGITLITDGDCESLRTIIKNFGNEWDYEMDFLNANTTLTVSAIMDDPEIKIIFEYYYTGEHKDLLYRINVEYNPLEDNNFN